MRTTHRSVLNVAVDASIEIPLPMTYENVPHIMGRRRAVKCRGSAVEVTWHERSVGPRPAVDVPARAIRDPARCRCDPSRCTARSVKHIERPGWQQTGPAAADGGRGRTLQTEPTPPGSVPRWRWWPTRLPDPPGRPGPEDTDGGDGSRRAGRVGCGNDVWGRKANRLFPGGV